MKSNVIFNNNRTQKFYNYTQIYDLKLPQHVFKYYFN